MPDSLLFLTILFCSYPLFTPPGPDLSNNNEHHNNAPMSKIKAYKINQLPCTICTLKSNIFFNLGEIYVKFQTLVHAEKQVGILSGTFGDP